MTKKKITLLDRAKADLTAAKLLLNSSDEVVIDICAYHCQQCIEKAVKFLIVLQGDEYANDHRADIYVEDLKNEEVKEMVLNISSKIDRWATTIRYHHSLLSNRRMVDDVISVCERIIVIAEEKLPKSCDVNIMDIFK